MQGRLPTVGLGALLVALFGAWGHLASAQIVISSNTTIATPMESEVHIVTLAGSPTTVEVRQPAIFVSHLAVFDNSILNFHGGGVNGDLLGHEASILNVLGGFFDDAIADGTSTFNVSGGHFDDLLLAENASIVNIRGGGVEAVKGSHDSRIFITGGFVDGMVTEHSASIFVTGSGFNHPYGPLEPRFGTVTGILANGDPFNATFNINGGSIVLVAVPEPTGLLFYGVLGAALLRRFPRLSAR